MKTTFPLADRTSLLHLSHGPHLAHEGGGLAADGRLVVVDVGPVGGAHLHQAGAALAHHVGDAKPAADLDQLAAGDDHLAIAGQGHEHQEHGGRVVVDHQGCLGAGEPAQELFGVDVARAALPGLQVVLQVGIAQGHGVHGGPGRGAQRRPTQVGVDDDARGIDGRAQGGPQALGQHLAGPGGQGVQLRAGRAASDRFAGGIQGVAGGFHHQVVAPTRLQGGHAGLLEQPVDAGQIAQFRFDSHVVPLVRFRFAGAR